MARIRCPATNAPASPVRVNVLMPVPIATDEVEVMPE